MSFVHRYDHWCQHLLRVAFCTAPGTSGHALAQVEDVPVDGEEADARAVLESVQGVSGALAA